MTSFNLSVGNAKINKQTLIFSLPAGKTCPGASLCQSFAIRGNDGKTTIKDGAETVFRCFAASSEALFPNVFDSRQHNWDLAMTLLQDGFRTLARALHDSIQAKRTKKVELVRIHESGDFYSPEYIKAWMAVAVSNPDLKFYAYTKSLHHFITVSDAGIVIPSNVFITASKGGRFDHLIEANRDLFPRYSVVVKNQDEADTLGLEIDHDESHCFGDKPFALLVHGMQPKGSEMGQAIRDRKAKGEFVGYNSKKKA